MHPLIPPQPGAYAWLMAVGILVSALWWAARSKRDPALLMVFIGALGGAFIGAKLAYILAESWSDWGRRDFWLRLATGKSILGGLLGGYAGVELMKRLAGHQRSTGDAFALILPLGLILGRIGCWLHGCCLGRPVSGFFFPRLQDRAGVSRWPAAQAELAFLAVLWIALAVLKSQGRCRDRLFFVFLAAYGAFRLFHEWLRDTPKWGGIISGYQIIAAGMSLLGIAMHMKRSREAAR